MDALTCQAFQAHWSSLSQRLLPTRVEADSTSIFVGLSGGLDSVVLAHLLATCLPTDITQRLTLVYIHHGLQTEADQWQRACEQYARQLSLSFRAIRVDARATEGQSPEEAARIARYAAFAELMGPGDLLLTAHHQDDQAETVLLQLMRGAGVTGLSGMPEIRPHGQGQLVRPLLPWSRAQLEPYADTHALSWHDDPSNADSRFDRNFMRHQVLPLLRQRWPAASRVIQRSAAHLAATGTLVDTLLHRQLQAELRQHDGRLSIERLLSLGEAQAMQWLLGWCRLRKTDLPATVHLQRIWQDVLQAAADRQPQVSWGGWCMRRYRQHIYLLPMDRPVPGQGEYCWRRGETIDIPGWGRLRPEQWPPQAQEDAASLCFRSVLSGRRHVKHWLQQYDIPPWQRDRVLFMLQNDKFVTLFSEPLK